MPKERFEISVTFILDAENRDLAIDRVAKQIFSDTPHQARYFIDHKEMDANPLRNPDDTVYIILRDAAACAWKKGEGYQW